MSFFSHWKLITLILVSLFVLPGARGCGGSTDPAVCTSDSMCAAGYACNAGECVAKPRACTVNNGGCEQGCRDWSGGHECSCYAGYDLADNGRSCENIDECSSDPCENGGTCIDVLNSYSCQCPAGWTGSTCATNINECAASPVLVSGAGVSVWNATFTRVEDECGFRGDGCRFNYRLLGTDQHLFANNAGYWVLDTAHVGSSYRAPVVGDVMTPPSGGWEVVEGFGSGPAAPLSFPEAPCGLNSSCADTDGSYECECNPGYREVGDSCENINECTASPVLVSGAGLSQWNATFDRVEDECGFRGDGCRFNYRLLGTDQHLFSNNEGYWVLDTVHVGSSYRAAVVSDVMTPPSGGWEAVEGFGSDPAPTLSFPEAPCGPNLSCTDTDGSYECGCEPGSIAVLDTCLPCAEMLDAPVIQVKDVKSGEGSGLLSSDASRMPLEMALETTELVKMGGT